MEKAGDKLKEAGSAIKGALDSGALGKD